MKKDKDLIEEICSSIEYQTQNLGQGWVDLVIFKEDLETFLNLLEPTRPSAEEYCERHGIPKELHRKFILFGGVTIQLSEFMTQFAANSYK